MSFITAKLYVQKYRKTKSYVFVNLSYIHLYKSKLSICVAEQIINNIFKSWTS